LNLLEAARRAGVVRMVYASSSSVYGDTPTLPKVETMVPDPLSPYAVGKLSGEHYLRVYARSLGVDGAALRYFNVFGPRQDPSSPYSGVISLFARMMRAGEAPRICGDGHQSRDFTYVANVVQANVRALEHPEPLGGIALNVGTGQRITIRELVGVMNRILGTSFEPSYAPARPGDVLHSQADLGLIERTLGYVPEVDLESGLRRTLLG
jgi:UDP-glucose 4-epimerase